MSLENGGTENLGGQPTGDPADITGQPADTTGQPEGTQEPAKGNVPNWEKDYKELQGKYTKESQRWSDLRKQSDAYGGMEQLIQTAAYLTNNPDFAKWVEYQQKKSSFSDLGIDGDSIDDETKQALALVEKVAGKKASEIIEQAIRQKVDPIENHYKEQMIDGHFKSMDGKYGAEWRDLQSTMAELAETLPAEIQDNPSLKDLETLYLRALVETGKIDEFAASKYQKKLEATKKASSGKPSNSESSMPKHASSIAEAFRLAKQAQS